MRVRHLPAVLAAGAALLSGALPAAAVLPYRSAGLTAEEAAAFLLDRFTFGPRPGDVDRVVELGLEAWLEIQLAADLPEPDLEAAVADLDGLDLPPDEMAETLRAAVRDEDRGAVRRLIGDLLAWKLYRAVLVENQLREVMTDFWLEHLYVSLTDPQTRPSVLSYERDAIRPHALGGFPELLRASARHPAMLVYLDNAVSTAEPGTRTTLGVELDRLRRRGGGHVGLPGRRPAGRDDQGLNENYARELLELHTLGVDGGYTEQDVREVARAFTGWSILPPGSRGEAVARRLERAGRLGGLGFVLDGGFLFRADAHDAEPKTVLGVELPAGRGVEDGEAVLRLLGRHPATARHVARALAGRRPVLVALFLRGGINGLAAVPLLDDPHLAAARPELALPATGGDARRLLDLDGRFGLHPAFEPLLSLWRDGRLAVVHGVGSPDPTRSHFDAQDYMETGTQGRKGTPSGWLNRAVGSSGHDAAALRAVGIAPALPRSLTGPEPALAVADLESFGLGVSPRSREWAERLEALYAASPREVLREAGSEAFEAARLLDRVVDRAGRPEGGARYRRSPLGEARRQIAVLIKAGVGLEVAFAETSARERPTAPSPSRPATCR